MRLRCFPTPAKSKRWESVRRYLYLANKALPADETPWLIVDAETARWNADGGALVDAIEFERLAGDVATRAQAVELYAGDLLDDVYDDWIVVERERLRAIYAQTLADLIESHRAAREHQAALGYAQRLLASDPFREDVVRQVMAIRYAAGDSPGALVEYERFADRLRAEMGVAPMPETQGVREAILRDGPLIGSVDRVSTAASRQGAPFEHALPFVGRERELAALRARWDRAARGFGNTAIVGGEAGAGKTRLTGELARIVEGEGGRVYAGGTSFPESLPYQCILEALRAALPVLKARPQSPLQRAILARVLPELRGAADGPEPDALAADREAIRLFDAFVTAVESLASPRPLLVVLEDLHWASGDTLDAIAAIARRIDRARVLLVGTYREDETPVAHPLRRFLDALGVEQRMTEVRVGRLDRGDVERLVASLGTLQGAPAATADRLYAFSEGNALFLNEAIVNALEGSANSGDDAEPARGIERIVASRLSRLTDQARVVAEIAALCGQGCSVDVVRDVAGLPAAEGLDAFNELLDHRLFREAGARDRFDYVFTHHLIGEAIYGAIDPAVRARRHGRIAHVLEQRGGDAPATARELARQFDLAGLPERAARWYVRAASDAADVYANEDALRLATLALDKTVDEAPAIEALRVRGRVNARLGKRDAQAADLDRLAALPIDGGVRCEVLWRRAALLRDGDDREAESAAVAAFRDEALALGDRRWQGLAASSQAAYLVAVGRYAEAAARASEASALLENPRDRIEAIAVSIEAEVALGNLDQSERLLELADSTALASGDRPAVAQSRMQAAATAMVQHRFERSIACSNEALSHYRAIGDRAGEARALANVATASMRLSLWAQGREANLAAAAIFEAIGDRRGLARVQMNLGMLHGRCGDLASAREFLASARDHHVRLGDRRAQTAALLNESFVALWQSDAGAARDLATAALSEAQAMNHAAYTAQAHANLGAALRDLGDAEAGLAHMDAGLAIQLPLGRLADAVSDLADAALARAMLDDLAGARSLCDRILALDPSWSDAAIFPPFPPVGRACVLHWSHDARAEEALALASRLATAFAASIDVPELRAHFES